MHHRGGSGLLLHAEQGPQTLRVWGLGLGSTFRGFRAKFNVKV